MKRSKAETLDEIIGRVLRQEGLETPLNEYRLISSWGEVVGETVKEYTRSLFIRNQILYVMMKSPALRENLIMRRKELVASLNRHVGAQVIVDIVFR